MMQHPAEKGTLLVVATPIGNLEDISLRALRVLKEADLILAEDTRRTRTLCTHHHINTKLLSFHAHSKPERIERNVALLLDGKNIALVSDAGTPLVSDPGAKLVQAASYNGIPVQSIPGPSAVTAALSVAGIPFDSFRFVGFLPRTGKRRRQELKRIAEESAATVLFESPNRLIKTLSDLVEKLSPSRMVAVCREITKLHEEVVRGDLNTLLNKFEMPPKGEITVVIQGGDARHPSADPVALDELIKVHLDQGMTRRDVVIKVMEQTSLPRKDIYSRVMAIKRNTE